MSTFDSTRLRTLVAAGHSYETAADLLGTSRHIIANYMRTHPEVAADLRAIRIGLPKATVPDAFARHPDRACRDIDTAVFFPLQGDQAGRLAARRICWTCPVIDECRAYAVDQPDLSGIWGGLTRKERNTLRRTTRRTA